MVFFWFGWGVVIVLVLVEIKVSVIGKVVVLVVGLGWVVWLVCDMVLMMWMGFVGNLVGFCVVWLIVEVVVVVLLIC